MHTVTALLCFVVVIHWLIFPYPPGLLHWHCGNLTIFLMNMDKYFMWIHYERLHNHNKAKHNKTVCIFLGIYCSLNKPWKTLTSKSKTVQICMGRKSSICNDEARGELGRYSWVFLMTIQHWFKYAKHCYSLRCDNFTRASFACLCGYTKCLRNRYMMSSVLSFVDLMLSLMKMFSIIQPCHCMCKNI